jgi:isoleucyl-tRNA synthetase
MIDQQLEDEMEFILEAVVLGRSARNASNIKNRQPLASIYIKTDRDVSEYYSEIVRDELNVKEAHFVPDVSAISSYSFKPQLKTVGPKYGKVLGKIREALANVDGNAAMNELETTGAIHFDFDGVAVELAKEDLLIDVQQKEGYYSVSDNGITVALCTILDEALIREGFVREVISKVQTMRKDSGFDVMDHIEVSVCGSEKLSEILSADSATFCEAVLCDSLTYEKIDGISKDWNINGEKAEITVKKI